MPNRLILVTGGSGYVGSALVPVIARRYPVRTLDTESFGNSIAGTPNVEFIKGDIRDDRAVSDALKGVTDVIHLAGIVTDELVDMNPVMAVEVNNTAMRGLCALAVDAGVKRFIYASSSSVYGAQQKVCTEDTEPMPMTTYAKTKLEGERILSAFTKAMTTVSVRCATLCGPAPRMRLDTIVNVFSKQAYFDGKITVHGGDQYRTNVHVQDVAHFYAFLLDVPAAHIAGDVFNFTRSNDSALELAQMVRDVAAKIGLAPELFVDTGEHDPRSYRMSAREAILYLGFVPSYTLADAVFSNFEWFKAGKIANPNDDLYYNNRRMAPLMRGEV